MGFIGKIFGAIFGFIGTIFGAIGKVFGLGGKSDYYVEIDSSQDGGSAPSTASAPKAAVVAATAAATATAAAVAATPVVQVAEPEPVKPVVSAPASVAATPVKQNGKAAENVTFAPDKLLTLSSTGGRRRPGPSLSPFKDMARQVQRPTKS